uniref:Plekhh1 n=1 Tax=Heliothis virescens TaxID=7102 RepID=A0A2A4K8Q0_HELVI
MVGSKPVHYYVDLVVICDWLSELEQRVLEAEGRAEEAEDKVRAMEQRLCEWPAGTDGAPRAITRLEGQIEEQKQLRLQDAKQVEAKAARIKEWVTNKLRELEQQNQLLREQNDRCNQQLELLRNHIAASGSRNCTLPINSSEPHYSTPVRHRRNLSIGTTNIANNVNAANPPGLNTMNRTMDERTTASLLADDLATAVENLVVLPTTPNTSTDGDTTHDYAEIYTPSRERTPAWQGTVNVIVQGNSRGGSSTGDSSASDQPRPPTPPLHRFPSWEAKIYQVADDGLQQSVEEELSPPPCPRPLPESTSYQDISVPVYATVKGRASQIRSMPFTGDSSDDSSDGEDCLGVTVHNTPHHQLVSVNPMFSGQTSTHQPINNVNHTNVLPASIQQTTNGLVLTNSANGQCSSSDTSLSASSPSKSVKTSSSLSPAKRSSSGSPSKQSKTRDTSFESGMSDDYAIPPDAVSCDSTASPSLASLCRAPPTTDSPRRHDALEKSGHLAKLGGKLKTWRKRWFVLKNGTLSYWKSQSEVNRKPQGQIGLGEACKISRNEGAATFEIFTGSRTYYLTADSIATMEDWIRVLQNVQRRNATKLLLSKEDNKPTIQGWLTKVKNGHAKKSWCVLIGKMFLYFKSPGDQNPTGQINMRDARVEDVEHVSDSDSEEKNDDTRNHLTVAIYPQHQVTGGPTYLLFESKADKDSWLYHLTVVSGGGLSQGTHFEQLVQKLMETDGDPNCVLWRHPTLLYSKENLTSPLTSLNSEALQAEALKLFKCVQLFMSVAVEQAGIDYHVVLAQNALAQCLEVGELQAELASVLARQTTPHTHTKLGVQVTASPRKLNLKAAKLKNAPLLSVDCKSNPPTYSFVQGWQLLALAVSLFVPRNNRLLWYLKLHLSRHADSKTECGKYAAYCARALERTIRNGGREDKPSRMEVLSILLKNPYHHCLPHAIPVHMLNNTYQVISFDGSTTVEEFLSTLSTELGCRESAASGFALFSDDPIEKDLEHHIKPDKKLCDVISKWETALREKGSGKFENSRVIRLTYRNRLYFKNSIRTETDKERLLLCYQVNQQVVAGRFPVTRELAAELGALMAQLDMGDYSAVNTQHNQPLAHRFYPYRYRAGLSNDELRDVEEKLRSKWVALKGRSSADCVRIYLNCTRKWPFFGATLFQARIKQPDLSMVWLAVSEEGVTVLELASMAVIGRYALSSIGLFGGLQDDLMMLIDAEDAASPVHKMLISLNKPKMAELTHLIADYKNALLRPCGAGTPQLSSLTRAGSARSLRKPATLPHSSPSTLPPRQPPHHTLNSHATTMTLNSDRNATLTLSSHTSTFTPHVDRALSHGQPDILKSTPDHHRTEKKRSHTQDSGVA